MSSSPQSRFSDPDKQQQMSDENPISVTGRPCGTPWHKLPENLSNSDYPRHCPLVAGNSGASQRRPLFCCACIAVSHNNRSIVHARKLTLLRLSQGPFIKGFALSPKVGSSSFELVLGKTSRASRQLEPLFFSRCRRVISEGQRNRRSQAASKGRC